MHIHVAQLFIFVPLCSLIFCLSCFSCLFPLLCLFFVTGIESHCMFMEIYARNCIRYGCPNPYNSWPNGWMGKKSRRSETRRGGEKEGRGKEKSMKRERRRTNRKQERYNRKHRIRRREAAAEEESICCNTYIYSVLQAKEFLTTLLSVY